ncbi:hypothetical protein OF83DRAFT_567410 [Amylostereum chailletii]|nr:hypothetical protein OF83DRAFT_567410 [Amylostereum chailletii]
MATFEKQLVLLQHAVRDSMIVEWNYVAAVTWVLYDILVTMDQEVHRMWKGRLFTPPALTFFVCRYFGLMYLIYVTFDVSTTRHSTTFCSGVEWFQVAGVVILSILVNMLLAVRIDAFYGGRKIVRWTLLVLYTTETICEVTFAILAAVTNGRSVPYPPEIPIHGCSSPASPNNSISRGDNAWLVNFGYHGCCLALIAYRIYEDYRAKNTPMGIQRTFVRDGVIFTLAICSGPSQQFPSLPPDLSSVSEAFLVKGQASHRKRFIRRASFTPAVEDGTSLYPDENAHDLAALGAGPSTLFNDTTLTSRTSTSGSHLTIVDDINLQAV